MTAGIEEFSGRQLFWQGPFPDVKAFRAPDHVRNRRGTGVAQKHGMLRPVAKRGRDLLITPRCDIVYDIGMIVPVENAPTLRRLVPCRPARQSRLGSTIA